MQSGGYYRRDVAGLRGVAVALVVLYHLLPSKFDRGFLGVDVFFVISGFVIALALERNLSAGNIPGLVQFYGSRIRRILPALHFNVAVVGILSCMFVPPSDVRRIFKLGAAAVLGASNAALYFAQYDYFQHDGALNPLLHTWSLGVESQVYLLFPAMMLVGARRHKNWLFTLLAVASFAYWGNLRATAPLSAFYNPLARMWEFLIGALVAVNAPLLESGMGGRGRSYARAAGAILLAIGTAPQILQPFELICHPFAVVGAAMIIAAGDIPSKNAGGLLSASPLVWIGTLSYSIYLWHYPLIAIARYNVDLDGYAILAAVLLVVVVVSILSYRFIEIPARESLLGHKSTIAGIVSCVFLLGLGYALYRLPPSRLFLGDASRYAGLWPDDREPLTASVSGSQRECHLQYGDKILPALFDRCSSKTANRPTIYLLGNSHAQHLLPMLETASRSLKFGYTGLTISSCKLIEASQLIESIGYRYDLCKDYFHASSEFIVRNARPGDIVLVGAHSMLLKPLAGEGEKPSLVIVGGRRLSAQEAYVKSLWDLSILFKNIRAAGAVIIVVAPTPQFGSPATQCAPEWFRKARVDCDALVPILTSEKNRYVETLRALSANEPVAHLWDATHSLCGAVSCSAMRGSMLVFRDRQHLSVYGSESLAGSFIEFLRRLPRYRGDHPLVVRSGVREFVK